MTILDVPLLRNPPVPIKELKANIKTLESPDVDNGIVVWAEQVDGIWDVYGFDLLDPAATEKIYVATYIDSNQKNPSIWNRAVV